MEDADRFFTKEGFWRLIFPQMLVLDASFVAIPSLVGSTSSLQTAALAGPITLGALWASHANSYSRARREHEALKLEFGPRYVQFLERDEVRLAPMNILMTSGPTTARRLLSKGD